jgi:hypothetical protein
MSESDSTFFEDIDGAKPIFDNFAFVLHLSRLAGGEEFEIIPGHVLRHATPDEIFIIKELLSHHGGSTLAGLSSPFEFLLGPQWKMTPLPRDEWRYFVIGFQGPPNSVLRIENAFCLAGMEFRILFTVLRHHASKPTEFTEWFYSARLPQMLEESQKWDRPFCEVSAADIERIATLLRQLQDHDQNQLQMLRITNQLLSLEALPAPPVSESRFLGYFGILESLLTHRPNPSDPYDSITRQVKKKLALLDHRWSTPLDYDAFGESKSETVWSKMYAYRSCLAHGETPDFSGELKILRNADEALKLLRSAVKAVARQALVEPRLIADLRDC